MNKPTKIPSSEWEVMEVLWSESPLSAAEILERMGKATTWSAKIVRTFLSRLQRKKIVSRRKIHGTYVFDPVVHRRDCLRQESQSFIDRFFHGNSVSLVVHLLEEQHLNPADVQRLRALLEKREGAQRGTGVPPVSGMGVPPMCGTGFQPVRLEGFQPSRTLDNGQDSPAGTSATGGTPVGRMGETPMPRNAPAPRRRQP